MPPASFSNMTDMLTYLDALENRINALESENRLLKERLEQSRDERLMISAEMERFLPKSGLFSTSFWRRAFTVWGHYFAAQLAIGIVMFFVYLLLALVILLVSQ